MLRLLEIGNTLPDSYAVDPNSKFQPGQISQLMISGNQILYIVANGELEVEEEDKEDKKD